jgi:hypothetical protein
MPNGRPIGSAQTLGTISVACALIASGCGTRDGRDVAPVTQAEEYRSLAARAGKAIAAAGESAGREYANRLRSERYPESGHNHHHAGKVPPKVLLRSWTMARLGDIRPPMLWPKNAYLARDAERMLNEFGYGTEDVVEHNYWSERPFVRVGDKRIKWMALVKKDAEATKFGLLLLQSYSRTDSIRARVRFPGAASLVDVFSDQTVDVRAGTAVVEMPADFSSRMFIVTGRRIDRHSGG